MQYTQPNDHEPIEIRGLHGAGPLEITATDGGLIHIALGDAGMFLDARGADDLVHAVLEALDAEQ
jgi:hypothetical protein